jgi:hypothetical protein
MRETRAEVEQQSTPTVFCVSQQLSLKTQLSVVNDILHGTKSDITATDEICLWFDLIIKKCGL